MEREAELEAELAAEREEIMRDHDEVEERHQAEFWGE